MSQDAAPRGVSHGDGAHAPSLREQAARALPVRRGRGRGVVAEGGEGGGGEEGGREGGGEGGEGGRSGDVGRWGLGSSPSGYPEGLLGRVCGRGAAACLGCRRTLGALE